MPPRPSGAILPPPVLYLSFVLAAWQLQVRLPLTLPAPAPVQALGWGLIGLGLGLMVWAAWTMFRARTTVNPYGRPAHLVERGPFRFSRNPIYLGDTLVYGGIGLLLGSLWPWLLLPALLFCMHRGVIVREERLLDALFGAPYAAYRQRVRRWFGRAGKR